MIPCRICSAPTLEHDRARVRNRYETVFLRCETCGFVFLNEPTWLEEAYEEPINASDTGYVARNLGCSRMMRIFIERFLNPKGSFLDYAGGYGLFVRLMRDFGYDFRWYDLYCENLFTRGFEAALPLTGPFEALSAFEVFEHLVDPRAVIEKMSSLSSTIVFSTILLPDPAPRSNDWWYFGLEHGQHVAFYSRKSLEMLATQFGYSFRSNNNGFHAFSRTPIADDAFARLDSRWTRFWLSRRRRDSLTLQDMEEVVGRLHRDESS